MDIDTIKSYLVELGVAINKASQSQFFKELAALENKIEDFAMKAVKGVGKAVDAFANLTKAAVEGGTKAAAAFSLANVGITKFLTNMGQAEIGVEKFASQFYISYDNARQLQGVLKALHANIEDLYRSPTLARQFQELRAESARMAVPGDYRQQIGLLQALTFQFTRLRLELTTSFQWIAYWFAKTFNGPISNITQLFKMLNDRIVQLMPVWTKHVAEWAGAFFRLDAVAFKALEYIAYAVEKMPPKLKEFGAALIALGIAWKLGPFGIMSAVLTGVLLLLDDFFTYMRGGESLLGPFWQKMINWFHEMQDSGLFKRLSSALQDLADGFQTMLEKIAGSIGEHRGILADLVEIFIKFEPTLKSLLTDTIPALINKVLDLTEAFLTWLATGDHLNEFLTTLKWLAIGMLGIKLAADMVIKPLLTIYTLIQSFKALKSVFGWVGNLFKGGAGAAAEGGAVAEGAAGAGAAAAEGGALATGGALAAGALGAEEGATMGILGGPLGMLLGAVAGGVTAWGGYELFKHFTGKKDNQPNGSNGMPQKSGYYYPGAMSPNAMTSNVKNDYGGNVFNTSPTFNIYSSGDPMSISNTVNKNLDDLLLYRLHRGVILA